MKSEETAERENDEISDENRQKGGTSQAKTRLIPMDFIFDDFWENTIKSIKNEKWIA